MYALMVVLHGHAVRSLRRISRSAEEVGFGEWDGEESANSYSQDCWADILRLPFVVACEESTK